MYLKCDGLMVAMLGMSGTVYAWYTREPGCEGRIGTMRVEGNTRVHVVRSELCVPLPTAYYKYRSIYVANW